MRRIWRLTGGNEQGSVFLAGLVLVVVMTLLGGALFDLATVEQVLVAGDTATVQSMYCAEAALTRWLNDSARLAQLRSVPAGGSLTSAAFPGTATPGTLNTPSGACTSLTVTYVDDPASGQAHFSAIGLPPATAAAAAARGVRVLLNFLPPAFEYATVANNGDLHLRGFGPANVSGDGGADVINGDVFIAGNMILGEPTSRELPAINPFSLSDGRPTISLPEGTLFRVIDNSGAYPTSGDPNPSGYRPASDMPTPDVAGYVGGLKAAAGMSALDSTGSVTATYAGSPLYNLKAIFDPTRGLGANADGSLRQPSGCTSPVGATGPCKIYWDLRPLNIVKNPPDRAQENADSAGDDYYFDGSSTGEVFRAPQRGPRGAQRSVDMAIPGSPPPIFLIDGNARFHTRDSYGFAINGRATIVATNDIVLSDNLMYKDGITNTDPATADMIGLVAQRDIWFGDPRYGTFIEGSGLMLAGRDFNFIFFNADGTCCRPPDNAVTLNGTMLANRQIAMFRDWADPNNANGTCNPSSSGCRPVGYDPLTGLWRFMRRAADGSLEVDPAFAPFVDCASASGGCVPGTRKITHYQTTINYDTRLRTNPGLAPRGLPRGVGLIFAGWQSWRECPPCQ